MKILGLTLQNDLKWKSNTKNMINKAYKRLWIIKRLKTAGASHDDLTDVYIKQIRSILEFGEPVWNAGLTKEEISDIRKGSESIFTHSTWAKLYKL